MNFERWRFSSSTQQNIVRRWIIRIIGACFLLSSMLQSYSKPTLYILLLVFSATNPLASSEFLANLHGCGDLKAGGGAGCRGRDGQGRRDGRRSRAWQIDTECTGTVGPLTYPDTVRIVRASHFLLKVFLHAQTNWVGYITVTARLLGIYGDVHVNHLCPRALPSDSGAINPYHSCYNYYVVSS